MPLKAKKQKRGFTLVEIIVSIGVLAIVSVFVLRMFVQSENTQAKARDADFAVIEVGTAMERVKALTSPDAATAAFGATGDGGVLSAAIYYDRDRAPAASADGAQYAMEIVFTEDRVTDAGALWGVSVKMVRLSPYIVVGGWDMEQADSTVIYEVSSSKYFPS